MDPLDAKREAAAAEVAKRAPAVVAAITFRAAAAEYVDAHKAGWKQETAGAQWGSALATYAYSVLGDRPVAEIGAGAVERVLKSLGLRAPETASPVAWAH